MIKEPKSYPTVKSYLKDLQLHKLEVIIDYICLINGLDAITINQRTKKPEITEARRLIIYVAKVMYNVNGNYIAERLHLDTAYVSDVTKTTFGITQVDRKYCDEIDLLIKQLKCR